MVSSPCSIKSKKLQSFVVSGTSRRPDQIQSIAIFPMSSSLRMCCTVLTVGVNRCSFILAVTLCMTPVSYDSNLSNSMIIQRTIKPLATRVIGVEKRLVTY
jgi:hypothetical protein